MTLNVENAAIGKSLESICYQGRGGETIESWFHHLKVVKPLKASLQCIALINLFKTRYDSFGGKLCKQNMVVHSQK